MHEHHADGEPIQIGDESLHFTNVTLPDPVPTGRQIIKATGKRPVDDFAALAILPDGALEVLRLDETFDLRSHGVERFLVCRSDTLYRAFIDGQDFDWPVRRITGVVLKTLAGVDPKAFDVFLVVPGADDIQVADHEFFDLAREGVEHFQTVPRKAPTNREITLRIVVNGAEAQIKVREGTPLEKIRREALETTQNIGRPDDDWEFKDEAGNVLDLAQTVAGLGLHDGDLLFLSLKAGVAGA
ncbi:multiubiquitin domain-containing protein [Methylobacterium ajmalii]|uniref:Multiubiquitin domain-containing protein n=1 Tax=Methylobacterium ajmalii TaxID=2738439 RepID=A0ABV0A0G5_9HYPH